MEPARALPAEDRLPVDVTGLELGHRGVAAVGAAEGGANPEATLREVEAVPREAPDPVVLDPEEVRLVDPALVDQVLDQPPDRVVDERRDHRRVQAEAALEPARHIVFAAALPDLERTRGVDAAGAGIQAEHDLAQADQVVAAAGTRLGIEARHSARS
jgi:hypothetical protein